MILRISFCCFRGDYQTIHLQVKLNAKLQLSKKPLLLNTWYLNTLHHPPSISHLWYDMVFFLPLQNQLNSPPPATLNQLEGVGMVLSRPDIFKIPTTWCIPDSDYVYKAKSWQENIWLKKSKRFCLWCIFTVNKVWFYISQVFTNYISTLCKLNKLESESEIHLTQAQHTVGTLTLKLNQISREAHAVTYLRTQWAEH